ncbi:MAG: hypothetical protein DMG05_30600 [Acidobacteria bacterium]|nr:MAG: hypothetical protein DMG05_30600 [Acidobacteriota bacterium]
MSLKGSVLTCDGSTQTSGLDLRQRETMLRGGKRGPAIVPGNADRSLLYQFVNGTGELKMPPGKVLAASDLESLRAWIIFPRPERHFQRAGFHLQLRHHPSWDLAPSLSSIR